jgi:hypothetical protein
VAGIVVSDDRQFIGEIRLREWEKVLRLITIALNPAPSTSEYKDFQRTLRRHSKHPLKPLSEEEVDRWFSFDSFKQLLGLVGMNSEDSGGLYSLHAHLNHSCEPNVQVRCLAVTKSCLAITDIKVRNFPKGYAHPPPPTQLPGRVSARGTNRLTMLSRRTIHPGEELTISYVDLGSSREQRRRVLREQYGFWCSCSRCAREKDMKMDHEVAHVHGEGCDHEGQEGL